MTELYQVRKALNLAKSEDKFLVLQTRRTTDTELKENQSFHSKYVSTVL